MASDPEIEDINFGDIIGSTEEPAAASTTVITVKPDGTRIIEKRSDKESTAEASSSVSRWAWWISIGILIAGGVYIYLKWKNKNKITPSVPDADDEEQPNEEENKPKPTQIAEARRVVPGKQRVSKNKGEEQVRAEMQALFGVVFHTEYMENVRNPKTGRKLEADIINHTLRIWCERHGEQHYPEGVGNFGMTAEDIKERMWLDNYKKQRAEELGYCFIVVKYNVRQDDIRDCIISQLTPRLREMID